MSITVIFVLICLDDETDIIANQRMEILKTNDKFMKELKKKYEEKKKVAAEAASPKKKP